MPTALTAVDVARCPGGAISVSGRVGMRLKFRKGREEVETVPDPTELCCSVLFQNAHSLGQSVHVVKAEDKLEQV